MTESGYSGTPLPKKLGIKPGSRVRLINAPDGFAGSLTGVPFVEVPSGRADVALLFAPNLATLMAHLDSVRSVMEGADAIWVAWPKRASGLQTDLGDAVVRAEGLARNLVDVKVCAIDATWSGLKFVIPVALR